MTNEQATFKVRDLMVPVLPDNGEDLMVACTAATCTCTATGYKSGLEDDKPDSQLLSELRREMREILVN